MTSLERMLNGLFLPSGILGLGILLLTAGPALTHGEPQDPSPSAYDYEAPAPGSYRLPRIKAAGGGSVVSAKGEDLKLGDCLAGKITLLSFIYTRCSDPNGCPLATSTLFEVFDRATADEMLSEDLRLISLSFDPENDTPEVMARYGPGVEIAEVGDARWLLLTTRGNESLAPILDAYDQPVGRRYHAAHHDSAINHPLRIYLIDRKGWIRNIYSAGFLDPRLILADVRTLLIEEGGDAGRP